MSSIKKTIKQNTSAHQRIRRASYVALEEDKNKKFKYKVFPKINNRFRVIFLNLTRDFNSIVQRPRKWLSAFDWERIKDESFHFILEVFIEGFAVNFVMRYLFGAKFNLATILSYGIIIVQGINIHKRLKNNGSHERVFKKE